MVKKSKKSKSKRMPLRKKHKIIKKVKEHHKKKAKEAKKQAKSGNKHKPVEKDPGIPNAWPFREQELAALEARRQRALEEKERQKQEKKERQAKRRAGLLDEDEQGGTSEDVALAKMAKDARQRDAEFDRRKRQKINGPDGTTLKDGSKRAFYREFQKVLEAADVVIQVLDARDPLGCRCKEVERMVVKSGAHKRVILLLNKIDLVPREVAEKWLKYLREELPTVAFKCSTQSQKTNLGQRSGTGPGEASSQCLGAETLLQLLKNYSRNQKLKTSITVGVVGFPNVGKSSLINSLKRTRVASVGSTPGVTKAMQEIHLDKNVKLLDSPGIVFATGGGGEAEAALRNAVKVEQLEDPVAPVRQILRLCDTERLMSIYKISRFADVDEFIRHVAVSRGKLKKGGVADSIAAAKVVLKDWNEGKIPYYTLPPERKENAEHADAALVSQWGKEFDVEAVFQHEATAVIAGLAQLTDGGFTEMPASAPPTMELDSSEGQQEEEDGEEDAEYDGEEEDEDEEEEDEEAEEDEDKEASGKVPAEEPVGMDEDGKPLARGREYLSQTEKLYDAEGILNPKMAKAERKRRKKAAKAAIAEKEEEEEGSDYDFATDFREGEGEGEGMDGVEEDADEEEEDEADDEEGDAEEGGDEEGDDAIEAE